MIPYTQFTLLHKLPQSYARRKCGRLSIRHNGKATTSVFYPFEEILSVWKYPISIGNCPGTVFTVSLLCSCTHRSGIPFTLRYRCSSISKTNLQVFRSYIVIVSILTNSLPTLLKGGNREVYWRGVISFCRVMLESDQCLQQSRLMFRFNNCIFGDK